MHRIISLLGILLFSAIFFVTPKMAFAAGETEDNNTIAKANPISVGLNNALNANLADNDTDFFKFAAKANRTYVIETFNIQGDYRTNATGLWLYNQSGTLIQEDKYGDGGTSSSNARIIFNAVNSEMIFIAVTRSERSYSWKGTYNLRVLAKYDQEGASWSESNDFEPNDVLELANELKVGVDKAQTHKLFDSSNFARDGDDIDFYHFTPTAGRTYVIETFNIQGSYQYDATGLWLYNGAGTLLQQDQYGDYGTGTANARLIFNAINSEPIFVAVARSGRNYSWTGNYSIRILPKYNEAGAKFNSNHEPNDEMSLAYPLEVGVAKGIRSNLADVTSYARDANDYDFYVFQGKNGTSYVIESFDTQRGSGKASTALFLYNSEGTFLDSDKYASSLEGRVNARLSFKATYNGPFYVMVKSSERYYNTSPWTGAYSIRVCANDCRVTYKIYLPRVRR